MSNICDFVQWRGDLLFSQSPLNEIDALVFAELTFIDYSGIADETPITLAEAHKIFVAEERDKIRLGFMLSPDIIKLFGLCAKAPRYQNVVLSNYINHIDKENEIQFATVAYSLDEKHHVIAFRGTDDTVTGWKEDFNMAFKPHVPSQTLATNFVTEFAKSHKGTISICGHSKGGNLAVYSASNVTATIQKRIEAIFNLDGPGFKEDFLESAGYQAILPKLLTVIPESCVVGCLFEQRGQNIIVESTARGILQHEGFSWQLIGNRFNTLPERHKDSILIEKSVKEWTASLNEEETIEFIDSFFAPFTATNLDSLLAISKNPSAGWTMLTSRSSKQRQITMKGLQILFKQMAANFLEQTKDSITQKAKAKTQRMIKKENP